MPQIVLLYLFFCILLGFPALTLIAVLYRQLRTRELLYYLLVFACMTVQILSNLLVFYQSILDSQHFSTFTLVILIVSSPFATIMYFLLPILFHRVLQLPYEKRTLTFLAIGAGLAIAFGLSPLCIEFDFGKGQLTFHEGSLVLRIVNTAIILYCIILPIVTWKRITNQNLKGYLRQFLIGGIIFLPGIIRDAFFFADQTTLGNLPPTIIFFPFFYLTWAAFNLFYSIRFLMSALKKTAQAGHQPAQLSHYLDQQDLTSREREIIVLVTEGLGNKAIAEKLFISPRTVSNHLYNSYQKLGIKTRYELLAAINNSK